jgi:hypothetical protein
MNTLVGMGEGKKRPWWRTSLLAAAILWAPLGIILFFAIPPEHWRFTAAIFASTAWFALWAYVCLRACDPERRPPEA